MPYVRREYIAGAPQPRVARFSQGGLVENYGYLLTLKSRDRAQIRHNALESARVAANKILEPLGEPNYHLRVVSYPHVVLRENKMVATAGADRLSEGMRRAFGKPVGLAARVENGSTILEVRVRDTDLSKGKAALEAARIKLPVRTIIGTTGRKEERKAEPEAKEKAKAIVPETVAVEVRAAAPAAAVTPVEVPAAALKRATVEAPVAAPEAAPAAAEAQAEAKPKPRARAGAKRAGVKPRAKKASAAAAPAPEAAPAVSTDEPKPEERPKPRAATRLKAPRRPRTGAPKSS